MFYQSARQCFLENETLLGKPPSDPILWNLSAGLDELTKTIEQDIREIEGRLDKLLRELQQQK